MRKEIPQIFMQLELNKTQIQNISEIQLNQEILKIKDIVNRYTNQSVDVLINDELRNINSEGSTIWLDLPVGKIHIGIIL